MPSPFRFRLERLLELRRLGEKMTHRDLTAAREAVREQGRALAGLMAEKDQAQGELRAMKQRTLDPVRWSLQEAYLERLDRSLLRERGRLEERVGEEAERRKALASAARAVRVLERLRERHLREHRCGLERREQAFLDEVGGRRERPA